MGKSQLKKTKSALKPRLSKITSSTAPLEMQEIKVRMSHWLTVCSFCGKVCNCVLRGDRSCGGFMEILMWY
jgi:hypothetical protein